MPLITLVSDYGDKDHYVASVKGYLYSNLDITSTQIVDISHQITPFNIPEAAYTIRNAWKSFPSGTIHLCYVDSTQYPTNRYLIVPYQGHFFIGPDNGLFSLIFEEWPSTWFAFKQKSTDPVSFDPFIDLIAPTAVKLVQEEMEALKCATPTQNAFLLSEFRPVSFASQIQGVATHIDRFGNIITNISKQLFEEFIGEADFEIRCRMGDPVSEISAHYHDVPFGEVVAVFNSDDKLELAIHADNASKLFNVKAGNTITVAKF